MVRKIKNCKICGKEFKVLTNKAYCSSECSEEKRRIEAREFAAKHRERNCLDYKWRLRRLWAAAKYRAERKGRDYDLDFDFILSLWDKNEGCCELTGQPFDLNSTGRRGGINPDAPSIDRKDSSRGYTKDNVRLITYHMNVALSEFGTETFERLAKAFLRGE